MKRLKYNFKKGMAFVLSLAMAAGLVSAMPGGISTVRAASGRGTGGVPSVSAFATKTQLMNAFTPDSEGNAANIGKLVFGKNSKRNAQEWYILGKDDGVSGDNTIIFAASPIATKQVFEDDYRNNKTDASLWSDCDYNGESITEVYANHYGASDLRGALQGMLKDTDGNTVTTYFTEAEQGMMNDTTVTTNDTKNNVDYTTTDKLYALQGDYNNEQKLWAGTNNQTVLAMNSYWSSGNWFWLRSPIDDGGVGAFCADPGGVGGSVVSGTGAVYPASNLKLSSVLFASAATAASSDTALGTITDGTAMTLRLDGKDKTALTDAGLKYNHEKITYTASSGIALVVQGRGSVEGGVKDWYYRVTGDGANEISASDIQSGLSLDCIPNLNDCKIWVEFTDTDGLTYAVMGEDSKGSVSVFATPDELMYSFTPDSDGNATTTGTLVFGKNSSGSAQEWYILGKDDGVSGDNTIIFAASPIAGGRVFNTSKDNKTYSYNDVVSF